MVLLATLTRSLSLVLSVSAACSNGIGSLTHFGFTLRRWCSYPAWLATIRWCSRREWLIPPTSLPFTSLHPCSASLLRAAVPVAVAVEFGEHKPFGSIAFDVGTLDVACLNQSVYSTPEFPSIGL